MRAAARTELDAVITTQNGRERGYPAYRPASVPWLGTVPEHWLEKRLKYAVRLVNEKTEDPDGLPYVGLEHIESWTGRHIEPATAVQPEGISNIFTTDDVLFGKLRPYLAKVLHAQQPGVCTAEALVLRPRLVEPRFLSYYILNRDLISVVDGSTYGSKMPRANWQFIGNLPALIPSLDEQRAIAAFLDRETARIDALIAKKQRLIELLQEKRTALISHAVTKGLNPAVPMKPSGIEWVGDVPSHWDVCKTKRVATLRTGHTPSRLHPEYWVDCSIPWFSLADVWQLRDGRSEYLGEIAERISELGLANSAAELLPARTVIVSRTASVGFSGIMPVAMATTQDFVNWICGPRLVPEYLLYVFRSMEHEFHRLTMGSTHKTIYMPDVWKFTTPVPPVVEQERIVAFVREHKGRIEQLHDKVSSAIERLREYRSALISAAVTGKIDVRNCQEDGPCQ